MGKRVFDIIAALIMLVLLGPVLLLVALAIKLTSPGPVLYKAKRVGQGGRLFYMYKFRTMVVGADQVGPRLTYRGDPRVTPIGRFLRKSRLDELPQLINVLMGEMSLVGPRPEDPLYVARYTDEQREVLSVRPGITGLSQLRYHNEASLLDGADLDRRYMEVILPIKLALDRDYIRRRSFSFDLKILGETILTLFGGTREV